MTDLTALTEITAPTTDDLVYVVDAPTGAKNPRKCSIANFHAVNDARTKTLTNTTIDAEGTGNSITNIVNANIKASAAIAYSKLNLTGAILNGDLAGSIANGKLATDPLARANHTGTQAHTTISDFDTGVQANRLDQMASPSAAVALGSQKITGLANGVAATDAATKGQLDTAVASDITLKGAYNANTNSPNLDNNPTAGTILKGDHYVVSVAGTFYSEALQIGDSLIATDDDPVEAEWIITNSQIVTPIVTANIADEAVTEGKLYISNAGNNGEFLSKQSGNNGGLTWATVPAGYNAPTIGSTSIGSGATVASLAGLTNVTATGTITGGKVTADNLDIDANQISASNAGGHIELAPKTTGFLKVIGNDHDGAITLNCTNNNHGQTIKSQPHSEAASNTLLLPKTTSNADSVLVSEISTQTLTNKTLGTGTAVTLGSDATLDIYYRSSTGALARLAKGSAGEALKINASNNALEWGTAGGGDEATPILQAVGYSAANQSPATEGSSAVSIFAKTIDSNNQGLYVRLKKNGQYEDVQIA